MIRLRWLLLESAVQRLHRLLILTFIESFATICIERGVLFLTKEVMAFGPALNLWLALVFGAFYVAGSFASGPLARRIGEKRQVRIMFAAQALVCGLAGVGLAMATWMNVSMTGSAVAVGIFVANAMIAALAGLKWPIIESFVSAGRSPAQTADAVGKFNVAWSAAVPVALAPTGLIIHLWPPALFLLPAVLHAASLLMSGPLPQRAEHLADHVVAADRGPLLRRYRALLVASRWQMFNSYALLWILAALTPGVFKRLGFSVVLATVLASLIDLARATTFLLLRRTSAWHGRRIPLLAAMVGLPLGFLGVLLAPNAFIAVLGELGFGFAAGMTYYAALYYAMVVSNASIDAGGAHEGLIGLGFAIGPVVGLFGDALGQAWAQPILGQSFSLVPLMLLCVPPAILGLRSAGPAAGPAKSADADGPPPKPG